MSAVDAFCAQTRVARNIAVSLNDPAVKTCNGNYPKLTTPEAVSGFLPQEAVVEDFRLRTRKTDTPNRNIGTAYARTTRAGSTSLMP
jgi:hypothetical protein